MDIKIERPTKEAIEGRRVDRWPVWAKEISRFEWHYDETEECYLVEGRAIVETKDGEKVEIKAGDFVTFPKGLACTWDIKEPVRKHFNFR
ncbi:MAG: cupin domain-containing protein [Thermodesulfovibrionales bacterium]|nr:cupin domain-containing protein [Thermodesulfovibrionales bacterium]